MAYSLSSSGHGVWRWSSTSSAARKIRRIVFRAANCFTWLCDEDGRSAKSPWPGNSPLFVLHVAGRPNSEQEQQFFVYLSQERLSRPRFVVFGTLESRGTGVLQR